MSAHNEEKYYKNEEEIKNYTAESLIRLLTRLIFIWFIKEKGLVNEDLFNKAKLTEILKDFSPSEPTYYRAILQNLFFATLNNEMDTPKEKNRYFAKEVKKEKEFLVKTLYRYKDYFKQEEEEKILKLFSKTPFLNGGLFECLDRDVQNEDGKHLGYLYLDGFSREEKRAAFLPNELFFGEYKEISIPEGKQKKVQVRGLISILESYKFTIEETTPVQEEIALDPELLGKVFENLLASYNPETQENARKQTGSFYTPREIVDYMTEESLLHYLQKEFKSASSDLREQLKRLLSYEEVYSSHEFSEKERKELVKVLANCKVLDPACGSGAFPMGVLLKMVHVLQRLDPENQYWREVQKEIVIEKEIQRLKQESSNNLTSEQIKQKALQTAKDELQEIEKIYSEIELQDYFRKLYLISNCIYGVDIQPIAVQITKLRFFISLVVDQKIFSNKPNLGILSLPNLEVKFLAANALLGLEKPERLNLKPTGIEELENKLEEIRKKYFLAKKRSEKLELNKQDLKVRKKISEILKKANFPKTTTEQIISWNPYDVTKAANWFDAEYMFEITNGFDIVIGNPPYIQLQKDGGKLAKLYEKQGYQTFARTGDIYALFYERGLKILKENGLLCYITSNKWMRAGYGERLRKFFTKYNPLLLIDLGPGVFETATVDTNILLIQNQKNVKTFDLKALTLQRPKNAKVDIAEQVQQHAVTLKKLTQDAWFIGNYAEQQLKEKIERLGKPLKNWDVNIYRGIVTGLNEAFIISTDKRNEILANCTDEAEKKRTEAIIKPILRGRDIKRYSYEWAGLWVIGTFPALRLNIEDYPAIKKYFLDNFDIRQLEQSGKKYSKLGFDARKKTGNKWFETQDQIGYYPEFEKEKVVWAPVNSEYSFTILPAGYYFNNAIFMITDCNVRLWCAIFNSKLIRKYMEFLFSSEENYTYASKENMSKIPLPPITSENEGIVKQIEEHVDAILSTKKQNAQADTSEWEREIDKLVYQLYELSEEEIKIVEGK